MNYVTLSMAIEKHTYVIKVSGGLQGIVPGNQEHLESLLLFVQSDEYYPSFIEIGIFNICYCKGPHFCRWK